MTSGTLLWGICSGAIALLLGGAGALAQAPAQPNVSRQKELQETMDLLRFAVRIRTVELDGFRIPATQVNWEVSLVRLGEVLFATYSTAPNLTFRVQGFTCQDKVLKTAGQDATILGASETAAAFYKANTDYLSFDGDDPLACGLDRMSWTVSTTNKPGVGWVTSHSRAIRHMSNWMRFLAVAGESQRAADFFVTILKEERRRLAELAAKEDHSDESGALQLFDRLLPRKVSFRRAA